MTEQKKRFECYLNIQSTAKGVIISGSAETKEEAQALFDHALEAYQKERKTQ